LCRQQTWLLLICYSSRLGMSDGAHHCTLLKNESRPWTVSGLGGRDPLGSLLVATSLTDGGSMLAKLSAAFRIHSMLREGWHGTRKPSRCSCRCPKLRLQAIRSMFLP
jgi:hypothetical protein